MTSSEITDDNYGDSCPSCGRARWEHPRDDFPCGQRKASLASKNGTLLERLRRYAHEMRNETNLAGEPWTLASEAVSALERYEWLLSDGDRCTGIVDDSYRSWDGEDLGQWRQILEEEIDLQKRREAKRASGHETGVNDGG